MKFSLLTPPTEVASRIPLSQGVPNAAAMAVNTSGMPRALPQAQMDVEAVTLPYQALARFAAVGGQVGSDVTTLVLHAEAKKREARNTAEIDNLYTGLTQEVDLDYAKMKLTENDETLIPSFNTMWATKMAEYRKRASSPEVVAGLEAKANSLLRVKSGEVTTTSTQKFVSRQQAEFEQTTKTLINLATNPVLTPDEQRVHQMELEKRYLSAASMGLYKPDELAKHRSEAMDTINVERAHTQAYVDPMGYLEGASEGNPYNLTSKRQRDMLDVATNQLRVQQADREHNEARAAKTLKLQQDDNTMTLRQQITENYGPTGPKTSMVNLINTHARRVGDDNYKSLLETDRIYQDRANRKEPEKPSDVGLVGELQAKLTTDRFREVSQADLLRYLKEGALDSNDHRYLSNRLDQAQQDAAREKPKSEAEKVREKEVIDAKDTIEVYIHRNSATVDKIEAAKSRIVARDMVTEMYRLAKANPDMKPDDIATQLIAKKMAQYKEMRDALPYANMKEVDAAFQKGQVPRSEAERYRAIFEMVDKQKPKTQNIGPIGADPPSQPGLLDRAKQFILGTPTDQGGIRQPTPKKTP